MINAFNKQVAVLVPEAQPTERKIVGGVRTAARAGFVALTVRYGSFDVPEGSTVYVRTNVFGNQSWATEVIEFLGERILLMPEASISLIDKPEPKQWLGSEVYGPGSIRYLATTDSTAPGEKVPGVNYTKVD